MKLTFPPGILSKYAVLLLLFPGDGIDTLTRQGISKKLLNEEQLFSVNKSIMTCSDPVDFMVKEVTDTTASYSWKIDSFSSAYEIEFKEITSILWMPDLSRISSNSIKLDSLKPGTRYDIRIRARCDTDSSNWISRQFNTTASTTTCSPPFDLKTLTIQDTEAFMSWSVKYDSVFINMDYKEKNSDIWIGVARNQGDKKFLLSGLKPETEYEWRVQSNCIPSVSDWVKAGFKTTGVSSCRAPFDLRSFEIRDSSAALSWSAWVSDSLSYSYDVEYKESTSLLWIAKSPYLLSHEIEYLENLKPSTNYDWRVRMKCDKDSSDWANGSFKTLAGGPPGSIIIVEFSFNSPPCEPALYNFSNNSTASGTTIKMVEWDFGDGTMSTSNEPTHVYKKPGTYSVILTAKDDSGRSYSKQKTVTINTLTLRFADAGKDIILCDEKQVQLKASGGVAYTWKPCTGLDNCNMENPTVQPGLIDTYIVTVTSADGCIDSDTININLINTKSNLLIPNAFTPNNDGINDQFKPLISLQGQIDAEWKLFNRFGNMIFSSNSSTAGWDGKYKGEFQPPGNYSYLINIKATGPCPARNMKGTVLLIR